MSEKAPGAARDLLELTKPRVVQLVTVTTALGFAIGNRGSFSLPVFAAAVAGASLVCAGVGAINQAMEVESDSLMTRTQRRPLPTGRLSRSWATAFGLALILGGAALNAWGVGALMAIGALVTALLYLLVYTPLKTRTWLSTAVGAIPGALPPLGGFMAASGGLGWQGWVLFGLLFFWQFPHFYAIAWIHREDYRRGGHLILPVVEDRGDRTAVHVIAFTALWVVASFIPLRWTGGMPSISLIISWILLAPAAVFFMGRSLAFAKQRDIPSARRLLRASVLALPLVLGIKCLELLGR
ncbi:MAG: heme o synthase [Spirochaetes bacterium]|nr:heme o synthase [Spirochaetota bacterium]